MVNKRRLSHGSTASSLLGDIVEEDEYPIENEGEGGGAGVAGGNRRRSMMGGGKNRRASCGASAAEQARIAEMYKTVIKMSSENKINEKNSWSLDLIDHMGKLIKEDSGARGVNFQKASCTLDASVKIYSHRVDDTYASSHRILESLSRNGVGEDDNGTAERAAARVGTKSASNRLNIAETIERNPENLNSASVESEHATDPMFHKMSKAFDEGGAKGMLMNNLRVSPDSCSLVFTSEGLTPAAGGAPNGLNSAAPLGPSSSMVDISHLVFKCGFSLPDLAGLTLCPTLAEYRKTLAIAEDLTGSIDIDVCSGTVNAAALFGGSSLWGASASASAMSSSCAPSSSSSSSSTDFLGGAAASDAMPYAHDDGDDDGDDGDFGGGMGFGAGDYDDGNADEHDDCDDEGNYIASNRRASMAAGGPGMAGALAGGRKSMGGDGHLGGAGDGFGANSAPGPQGKIRWDESVLNGDHHQQQQQQQQQQQPLEWEGMGVPGSALTQANDYAFFDLEALMKSNSWAGARHWRYATRRREAATVAATAEEGAGAGVDGAAGVGAEAGAEAGGAVAGKAGKTAAKGGKKAAEATVLLFNGEVVAESAFAVSAKSRGDTTLMTAAAVEKDITKAQQGELFLPMDSKIEAKDLCRLFLCPPMIVPPAMLYHMLVPKAGAAPSSSGAGAGSGDMFWGQIKAVPATPKPIGSGYNDYDDVDDDDDGYGGGGAANYGDDDFDTQGPQTGGVDAAASAESQYQVPEGLGLNTDKLLQAARVVEKVDIGYATVAKKVNVRKLKGDLWGHINTQVNGVLPGADDAGENAANSENIAGYSFAKGKDKRAQGQEEPGKVLSFQEVVNSIAQKQEQGDVSLPFYFICLLHLANEKLKLSNP